MYKNRTTCPNWRHSAKQTNWVRGHYTNLEDLKRPPKTPNKIPRIPQDPQGPQTCLWRDLARRGTGPTASTPSTSRPPTMSSITTPSWRRTAAASTWATATWQTTSGHTGDAWSSSTRGCTTSMEIRYILAQIFLLLGIWKDKPNKWHKFQMRAYFKHHGMGIEVLPLGIDEEQGIWLDQV